MFINNFGYSIKISQDDIHPKELQKLLEKIEGSDEEALISRLTLRSLKRAQYTTSCTGHFGLAAKYYCHFTSPIRRYPDLQIHRIIKEYLNGKIDEKRVKKLTTLVDYASKQSSETERVAQQAEREVDDLKKAEYMLDRLGEEFEGIVSSVTSFGMFVELPSTIEGLVHITALDDDYYVYNEDHLCLIGERTKKVYRLGDSVKVKCSKVDIPNREIFFELVEDEYSREEIKATKELIEKLPEVKQELIEEVEES